MTCCGGYGLNIMLCVRDKKLISLPHFMQYVFSAFVTNRMHVLEYFNSVQASFRTQLPERKETAQVFHHEVNGDFKTVTEFNGKSNTTQH